MNSLEGVRDGVRRGIRDALEGELDRTRDRTVGRLVTAGALEPRRLRIELGGGRVIEDDLAAQQRTQGLQRRAANEAKPPGGGGARHSNRPDLVLQIDREVEAASHVINDRRPTRSIFPRERNDAIDHPMKEPRIMGVGDPLNAGAGVPLPQRRDDAGGEHHVAQGAVPNEEDRLHARA